MYITETNQPSTTTVLLKKLSYKEHEINNLLNQGVIR